MTDHVYRIIDANCNRIGEGLRVLEDITRFILNDISLSRQLKYMRHQLIGDIARLNENLLTSRDSDNDLGPSIEAATIQADISAIVSANCKRIEEALRSVEELAKLPELSNTLSSDTFNHARFSIYSLERDIQSRINRQAITQNIKGLYAIIDTGMPACRDIEQTVQSLIKGGAKTIQLRDSVLSKREKYALSIKIKKICLEHNILFIVNNDLDIALAADADGIHIGQNDLPLPIVRTLLPINKIVGCSTHGVEEALTAVAQGADYIGVGSMFPTSTKQDAAIIGTDTLRHVREKVSIPLVAIGGINRQNISHVIDAGADAVAVICAILSCENIEEATRALAERFDYHGSQPQ